MRTEPDQSRAGENAKLERVIVLVMLSEADHGWSVAELAAELSASPAAVEVLLGRLCLAGVLCRREELLFASPAARRLDELDLVAI